jgi:hypothetical protein
MTFMLVLVQIEGVQWVLRGGVGNWKKEEGEWGIFVVEEKRIGFGCDDSGRGEELGLGRLRHVEDGGGDAWEFEERD